MQNQFNASLSGNPWDEANNVIESASARTAEPADGAGEIQDAPPTNRASDNSNIELPTSLNFIPLRWGVDSLYLSYHGRIHLQVDDDLKRLKVLAQSSDNKEQAQAQFLIDSHIFEVKDKGTGRFPYILEDNAYRIQVARKQSLPLAYAKIASDFLAHTLPSQAKLQLDSIIEQVGVYEADPTVSRIDLFVDFVSDVEMDSWTRDAWVTRASAIDNYSRDQVFTGWAIGTGSPLSARLYNKTKEIEKSGKTYLFDLWAEAGWDRDKTVWRLEFEFKREVLSQFRLTTLDFVLSHLNGLWSYATTDWLKLTIPNTEDKTRSRWPLHPLWGCLSSVDWETDGGPLLRQFTTQRTPSDDYLFSHMQSLLTSFMAKQGIIAFTEGKQTFYRAFENHFDHWCYTTGIYPDDHIESKVRQKARIYNTLINLPDPETVSNELRKQAEQYRKQADGE